MTTRARKQVDVPTLQSDTCSVMEAQNSSSSTDVIKRMKSNTDLCNCVAPTCTSLQKYKKKETAQERVKNEHEELN